MKNESSGKIYHSFEEIAQEVFGLKPYRRVTKDKQKLAAFVNNHSTMCTEQTWLLATMKIVRVKRL